MIGIDLFAGAGGMSLGAAASGIKTIAAVECDPWAANTYETNFKGVKIFKDDIRNVKIKDFDVSSRKEPLIIYGGPPCQGFSTSNQMTRSSANPLNWLFLEYIRIVEGMRPDWLVFENVRGILETEGGIFLEEITKRLRSLGYNLFYSVLNAVNHGIPQSRSRIFIIGSLNHDVNNILPEKTSEEVITVKDAISDLPVLSNGANINELRYKSSAKSAYAAKLRGHLKTCANHLVTNNADYIIERYSHIPQGGNWENIPLDLMHNYKNPSNCHTLIYHRLKNSDPSVVIGNYRKNMIVHPTQNRGLSVREAARIQSFPDWFEFKGSIGFQQQQVGNAVPPFLSEIVFNSVMETEFKSHSRKYSLAA